VQWGYNQEKYANTDIKFSQPALGNDFTLQGVRMADNRVWDLFDHSITVPQYSFRVGKFIGKNTGIELNFDHAKAHAVEEESARMTGTLAGQAVDQIVRVGSVLRPYKLNNGANFVLFNVVQRLPLVGEPGKTGSISALARAGVGFMVPHTENSVLGEPNEAGFQYGGLGAGLEGAIRFHIWRGLFFEASDKVFYGRYRNVRIHEGRADHDLKAHMQVFSGGVSF
jgi:hypothetical protein